MKFEIESAANFLSNMLKMHSSILSAEQLERFKEAIESHLEDHYQHHWFPDRPTKGSGYRCIRINHKMDPLLCKAGQSCGIDSKDLRSIFPNELTLWVDPSEVAYRIGENGSICVLFDGQPNDNDRSKNKASKSPSNSDKKIQSKTRTTSGGRCSPTDSTLSSSTSTMSSPSPSSSPDWIRYERHASPDNWTKSVSSMEQQHHQQHRSRSSPVSVMNPIGNNSSNASFGMPEGVGLFGFPSHHHHGQYAFNSGVVNSGGSALHHHHHHSRSQQNGPQNHFGYNGWASPFRG